MNGARSGQPHAVAASCVFDGKRLHRNAAVVIDGARISGIVSRAEVAQGMPLHELPESIWLAPGFIDVQVNGGGDALFNDAPTPETIRKIVSAHRRFGTTALLPTLISDSPTKMKSALVAVEALSGVEPGVLGIHLEGPFLSLEKRGVHDRRFIRQPTSDDFDVIAARHQGVTLVTLAPEQVPSEFIGKLVKAGVRVALGHSMATYAQTQQAIAAGLTGFTHLFNAMRALESREPGPIAAALESVNVWYGLIVDGIHVAPAILRLALRGLGRPMLVTDAMPPVGGTLSTFNLNGETIVVRDGRCMREDGRLAGACLDMASAVRNCVRLLDVPLTQALRFASTNPAHFLGLGDRLGKLAPGYRADMVAIDSDSVKVQHTWVAGQIA
ncbi:MAG: N-acetylglucosamine-6-phosphate deacetylase [Xanthobacteraceae bacterium]|jgi:N-acetylglucosamine-6-phosphate deacetylase